eukprot:TRINITY_DN16806_c0_g1_i2.p1 TRINITY_DN16806_c0_g1~~TRINITY_DN16806_c0_g1_i2.p1  ORF type:complete len:219 (-),score=13.13 TRINITY_DN16806_c0_g1_i2:445-1101(-)
MWVCAYVLISIYIDLMLAMSSVWNYEVSGWCSYMRYGVKFALVVILAWRFSSRTLGAGVTALVLIASIPFGSTICKVSPHILGSTAAREEGLALWANRIVEVPLTWIRWVISARAASPQVVPLPSLKTCKFVSRTCTWVELSDSCDGARGIQHDAACCICLERIELDELVTQLTCKHFFHANCASQWVLRCTTRCGGGSGSLCPMRCPLANNDGLSGA